MYSCPKIKISLIVIYRILFLTREVLQFSFCYSITMSLILVINNSLMLTTQMIQRFSQIYKHKLHNLQQRARGTGLHVNSDKTNSMHFPVDDEIFK